MSSAGKTIGQNNAAEVLTGALVVLLIVAALVLGYSYKGGGSSGYDITAQLPKVDGLGIGTDVRISGMKVGTISDLKLNPNNYLVLVTMDIDKDVQIPTDSSLQVTSTGILGGQYISIQPGGDDKVLTAGGVIQNVQGSADLMSLIGHFIGGGNGSSAPPPSPANGGKPQNLPAGP